MRLVFDWARGWSGLGAGARRLDRAGVFGRTYCCYGNGLCCPLLTFWCVARVPELDIEAHPRFNPRTGLLRLVCGLVCRVLRLVGGFFGGGFGFGVRWVLIGRSVCSGLGAGLERWEYFFFLKSF